MLWYSLEAPQGGASNEYHNIQCMVLLRNICCGYSLEAPKGGASNEYHNMFLLRNKKIIMWLLPLIWSYTTNNYFFQSYFRHIFTKITIFDTKGWSCEQV